MTKLQGQIDPKHEALVASWLDDHTKFVQQAILDPYNEAKGTHYFMTDQQRDASIELTKLVKEKMAGRSRDILGLSIMSGKGTGKDAWASWAIMWFLSCFPFPKIPCISVSDDQLKKVLWSEIAKWLVHSAVREYFVLQNDKLYFSGLDHDMRGKRWMAFTKAANPKQTFEEQVETLAGIHEDFLLEVVDEGSGILESVFEVLEGNLTGPVNLMLVIFNPTRSKGYAVDTQYKNADHWITRIWNAEESPIVERATIDRIIEKHGKDSNPYRIRVLGLPPLTDEQTLIPWDWIQDAINRPLEPLPTDPLVKGVDCGAGGNRSVIATRKGGVVYPFKRDTSHDSHAVASWIGVDIDAENPDEVRIDTIGIGWGVHGMVAEKKGSFVKAADARRTADNPLKFYNKRAEMHWRMRERFEAGTISIPDDPELIDQLGALKCEYVKSQLRIIDKKKITQAIGHSPDDSDALAMTFYHEDKMVSKGRKPLGQPMPMVHLPQTAWMGN